MFTCWYEQLQLVVINGISIINARMFNVISNELRSIKHIQIFFCDGYDLIVIGDFH